MEGAVSEQIMERSGRNATVQNSVSIEAAQPARLALVLARHRLQGLKIFFLSVVQTRTLCALSSQSRSTFGYLLPAEFA